MKLLINTELGSAVIDITGAGAEGEGVVSAPPPPPPPPPPQEIKINEINMNNSDLLKIICSFIRHI